MPSSRTPQESEPEDCSGLQPRRGNGVTRIQILAGRYLARHPALFTVLEALGANNPGGGMNP